MEAVMKLLGVSLMGIGVTVAVKFQIPKVRELLSCLMQTCLYVILRP